jgi:hypothetical protein
MPKSALSGADKTQFQVHLASVGLTRAIRESSLLSMAPHDGDARDCGRAKRGANDRRHGAAPGHVQPLSLQLNGTSGHVRRCLLESYSAERAPVGAPVVARANQSRIDYGPVNAAFRTEAQADPVAAGLARLRDPGPGGVQARAQL